MRRPGHSPAPVAPAGAGFSALQLLVGAALVFGLGACKAPCDQLRAFVCDGGDAAYCEQVDGFLREQQVDAEGQPLEAAAAEESCRYIMGNVEIKNAYRFKAKQRFLGEPYWQVLKNMKPPERKAWRKAHGIPEPVKPTAEKTTATTPGAEAAKTPAKSPAPNK